MANKLDEKTVAHNVRMNTDDQYRRNQYAKARYKEMGAAEKFTRHILKHYGNGHDMAQHGEGKEWGDK